MLLDTPEAEINWSAEDFSLQDPKGNQFQLSDLMGKNGLVIAFICNHCPYVKAVIERFVADAKALQSDGINVVAINANDYSLYPEDSPEMMTKFATEHGFVFPYLIDEDQSVARAYGAVCTPDFFGFNGEGRLQYRGRIDDAGMGEASHRTPELLDAMRLIAATGTGPEQQSASIGCSIKWRGR